MAEFKRHYFILAALLLLVEIMIAMYVRDKIIRPYGGDFLVVIFLYCLLQSFFVVQVRTAALTVLLFSYLIETLQYLKLVWILGLSKYSLAKVVLGTSFEWADIIAYTLGILFVIIVELKIRKVRYEILCR